MERSSPGVEPATIGLPAWRWRAEWMPIARTILLTLLVAAGLGIAQFHYFRFLDLPTHKLGVKGFYWFILAAGMTTLSSRSRAEREAHAGEISSRAVWLAALIAAVVAARGVWALRVPDYDFMHVAIDRSDQSAMVMMLRALLDGPFDAPNYYYGLGYPLLGYVGHFVMPSDPYLVVGIVCLAATVAAVTHLTARLCGSVMAGLVAGLFLATNPLLLELAVRKWSTAVTIATFSMALVAIWRERIAPRHYILFGLAAGLDFAARYVDLALFAPIGLWLAVRVWRARRDEAFGLAAGASVGALCILAVLASHWHYFGSPFETPYRWHKRPEGSTDQDLATFADRFGYPLLVHLYGTLFDAKTSAWDWTRDRSTILAPLFAREVVLFVGLAGVLGSWRSLAQRLPRGLASAIAVGVVTLVFIYGLHPGSYPGCIYFGCLHYFQVISVVLVPVGMFALRRIIGERHLVRGLLLPAAVIGVTLLAAQAVSARATPKHFPVHLANADLGPSEALAFTIDQLTEDGDPIPSGSAAEFAPFGGTVRMTSAPGSIPLPERQATLHAVQVGDHVEWQGTFPFNAQEALLASGTVRSPDGTLASFTRRLR